MRRSKLNQIIEILEQEYPEVRCSLNWSTPLELLISTQLSAQCTDARVNMVTPALFERCPDAKAFAEAEVAEIETYIHSTGLYKNVFEQIDAALAGDADLNTSSAQVWVEDGVYKVFDEYYTISSNKYTIRVAGYNASDVLVTYQNYTYKAN